MIFASNNAGKLKEVKEIFKDYEIYSLKEKNINIDVVEDGATFYENALKKAKEIYKLTHEPVIADDSGLCIKALEGFPGVLTHRFLGDNATDEDRNVELINRVKSLEDKTATVECNIVYYDGNTTLVGLGILCGKIVNSPRGTNGFGFDPIFELNNGKTLAELTFEQKNEVSARRLALDDLLKKLKSSL